MMRKIAMGLAAAVIATGGLTLGASARVVSGGGYVHGPPIGYNWPNRNPYYHPRRPWTRLGLGGIGIYGGRFLPHHWSTQLGHGGIYGGRLRGFLAR